MNLDASILNKYVGKLEPIPTQLSPNLDCIKPYRAILFDVYGTLLISGVGDIGVGHDLNFQTGQLQQLLHRYAITISPEDLERALQAAIQDSHDTFRQRGVDYPEVDIKQIWAHVLGIAHSPWVAEFALEYEMLVNPVCPMPGVFELLSAFSAAGISMGLISNAQFFTVFALEGLLKCSLTDCGFDHRLLFYSWLEGHAKPSPVMFERARSALTEMAIPAASVLYVGNDMLNDILPAASVGFNTALFAGDQRSLRLREGDRRCQHLTPDLIVTDLRQLLACFGDTPL